MSEAALATKLCPFCAEVIQDAAIKCKHCGSMIATPAKTRTEPAKETRPASGAFITGAVFFAMSTLASWALTAVGWIYQADQVFPNYWIPTWNSIMSAVDVVIFVGYVTRHEWARQWTLGTSLISALWFAEIAIRGQAWFVLVAFFAAGVAFFAARSAKPAFVDTSDPNDLRSASSKHVYLSLLLMVGAVVFWILGQL